MQRDDYERIVRTHMDTIYRIAVSYTKTPSDADDIVQQTFVKLLTKQGSFADAEHEKRWLPTESVMRQPGRPGLGKSW